MSSRPHSLIRRLPSLATPFMTRRLRTASARERANWRVVRWKNVRTLSPPEHAKGAASVSMLPLVCQWQQDPNGRLTSIWRCADVGETLEPATLPPVLVAQDSNRRQCVREITRWQRVSYVGRLMIFNLPATIIHLTALSQIFLHIGS
jgi:hypothetical protein